MATLQNKYLINRLLKMTRQFSVKRRSLCLCILLFTILQLFVYFKSTGNAGSSLIQNGRLSITMQGRLGNQMFQYASILGLGDMMNFSTIVIDGGDELLSSFQLTDKRVTFSPISYKGKTAFEYSCCSFQKELTSFRNTEAVHFDAYLMSWKYFHNIENHIRKEFTFTPSIVSKSMRIKLDIASQFNRIESTEINRVLVGVHVRRGDFLTKSKAEFGHFAVNKEYIIRAMALCKSMFGDDIGFVFCSDDISWVKDNFSNNTHNWNMVFVEGNPPAVDMAVLSLCDHTIVTTGTFGWWAAWLAGGKTIISKQQAREGSHHSHEYMYSDYFYPDWIVIE